LRWLIVNKFYNDVIGGVETLVDQHVKFLLSEDEKVTVICCASRFQFLTKISKKRNLKVIRCSTLFVLWGMPISFSFFYWLLRESKVNTKIEFHYPFPLADIGSFFMKKKSGLFLFWHSDIIRQRSVEVLLKPFTNKLIKRCHIITTSPVLAKESKYLKTLPSNQVSVVPISLPAQITYHRNTLLNIPDKYFLSLGRISSYKGIDILLKAICLIKNQIPFPLLLVGDGPLLNDMENFVKDKNIQNLVSIIPYYVNEEEKQYLFKNSEFFVLPSTQPSEAFGITQLEALRANKPILNTRLKSGVPWVSLDRVTGITVKPSSVSSFADGLKNMFDNYKDFKNSPKKRFEEVFQEEKVKLKLLKAFKKTNII